jgi:hypothetical protein
MYTISPAAWTAVASSSLCASASGATAWLWMPLGAFALLNAGVALLRILVRSEA